MHLPPPSLPSVPRAIQMLLKSFVQALGKLMERFVLEIKETSPAEEAASPVCLELFCHNNGLSICLI